MTSRTKTLWWLVGFLALLAAATYFVRPQAGQLVYDVKRTSFRTTPDGVAALYRGISRLGTPVAPRMTPFADADPLRGTLVMLEPTDHPSAREISELLDWVRNGATLLYAPRFSISPSDFVDRTLSGPLLDSLGLALVPRRSRANPELSAPLRWAAHPLTEGLPAPEDRADWLLRPSRTGASVPVRPLLRPAGRGRLESAAAELLLEKGRVIVLADGGGVSNGRAAVDPLAVLAVRAAVAHTPPGDTVFFDEFHHGVHGLGSPLQTVTSFLFGRPGGRAIFHLGVVSFLALVAVGIRLGAPADPPKDERRSPLEHVSALASLYREAGARETAALRIMSRLCRVVRAPPPTQIAQAEALLKDLENSGTQADSSPGHIRRALQADPPDLAAVAAGVDEYLQRRHRQ